MTFETIRYEVRDHVARIALARPDKRNAMNADMFRELGDAAEQDSANDVFAVLVTGGGPTFRAGIDHAALAGLAGARAPRLRSFVRMTQRPFRVRPGRRSSSGPRASWRPTRPTASGW